MLALVMVAGLLHRQDCCTTGVFFSVSFLLKFFFIFVGWPLTWTALLYDRLVLFHFFLNYLNSIRSLHTKARTQLHAPGHVRVRVCRELHTHTCMCVCVCVFFGCVVCACVCSCVYAHCWCMSTPPSQDVDVGRRRGHSAHSKSGAAPGTHTDIAASRCKPFAKRVANVFLVRMCS